MLVPCEREADSNFPPVDAASSAGGAGISTGLLKEVKSFQSRPCPRRSICCAAILNVTRAITLRRLTWRQPKTRPPSKLCATTSAIRHGQDPNRFRSETGPRGRSAPLRHIGGRYLTRSLYQNRHRGLGS